jgi:hypothetical protein
VAKKIIYSFLPLRFFLHKAECKIMSVQVVFPLNPAPASIYVGGSRYPSSIIVERESSQSDDLDGKFKILQQTCEDLSKQLIDLREKVTLIEQKPTR